MDKYDWAIKALVWFGVAGCIIALAFLSVGCSGRSENHAKEWMAKMGWDDVDAIDCMSFDSDNDGYVSCTARRGDKLIGIDCAAFFSLQSGCRMQKGATRQQ